MPTDYQPIVERLRTHLRAVEHRYPGAWKQLQAFRADRRGLGDWPAWCYCPLAGAYAIVSGGGDQRVPLERGTDIAVIGGLGAWRATQGIYVVDETLLGALWETPVDGDVPSEALQCLPEWCVYVAVPAGWALAGQPLSGYFAWLDYHQSAARVELRLLLDTPGAMGEGSAPLLPVILHLGHGSLAACVSAALDEAERQAREAGAWADDARRAFDRYRVHVGRMVGPLLGPLLYLCAEEAELRDARGSDDRPVRPHRGTQPTPKAMRTWEVGYHLEPALRRALEAEARTGALPTGDSHASPRPHLRRAHWHTYVLGPRADATRQRRVLRWLPPIPVKIDGGDDLTPTIRPVG